VVALAVLQLLSALSMYGRIPGVGAPSRVGVVHVWSGRLAVAVHCLYALGLQCSDTRVLVHSVLGTLKVRAPQTDSAQAGSPLEAQTDSVQAG
jgi:Family of unknown function (DUF6529)